MASAPGIRMRHSRTCRSEGGGKCNCKPTFEASVFSVRDGKKIRQSFPTLAAAKGWRIDARAAVAGGKLRASTAATIADEARAWMGRVDRGEIRTRGGKPYKPAVLRLYRRDLETYIVPELGALRVSQLRRRDVQAVVDELVGRGLSGSRIRGIVNALRAVLRRPLQDDELTVNPTDKLSLPEDSKPRERAASVAEAADLLAALPVEHRALWAVAFYAGLRRGELRGLRWSDIDDSVTEIRVQRGWDEIEGEIAPKSAKGVRRVPVAGALRLILLEHRARTGRRGDDLVFGRTATEPFTPTHVRTLALKAWAVVAVGAFLRGDSLDAELVPIGLHECRHTFVSLMFAAGRSLEEIGDYVGHSSAYMTDQYRHLLEGARTDAADALDALLAGARTGAQAL